MLCAGGGPTRRFAFAKIHALRSLPHVLKQRMTLSRVQNLEHHTVPVGAAAMNLQVAAVSLWKDRSAFQTRSRLG